MIVTDLDDSLLRDDHTISDKNKNAINYAISKGVYFIFASGRGTPPVKMFMNMINLELPLISYNGARIVDIKKNECIYKKELAAKQIMPILDYTERQDLNFVVYCDDIAYVNKWNDKTKEYSNFAKNVKMELIKNKSQFNNMDITKVLIHDERSKLLEIKPELERIKDNDVNCFFSKPYFIEFTNKNATKGQAVKYLSEKLKIKQEEIIAIGDSYNDISMIEYAGLGVCVENGFEDVKQFADYITFSNENDGVANVIEKFIE
jgi:Cof subfamily protein (haloacid dehalogenase superfamily)